MGSLQGQSLAEEVRLVFLRLLVCGLVADSSLPQCPMFLPLAAWPAALLGSSSRLGPAPNGAVYRLALLCCD